MTVAFVPMESLGNYDPVKVYEELILHYETLKGTRVNPVSCSDCCDTVIPLIYQIATPIISGIGQLTLIYLLPSVNYDIEPTVRNDLGSSMLRYLSETRNGTKFAIESGYKDVAKITFNQFMDKSIGGIVYENYCWNDNINFSTWRFQSMVFQLGGYSLLSSTVASILHITTPFVINKLIPTEFPNIQYLEAKGLINRTNRLLIKGSEQLTTEQINNLKTNRKSLSRLKNRTRILLGVSGAIFILDLGVKFYLVSVGIGQIKSATNPQTIYRPGLPDFCWSGEAKCDASLQPFDRDTCSKSYPSDFLDYAKEQSTLDSSAADLGIWKIWTVVMLPLAGRLLENIPVIFRTTKEAIQRCRWPKGRRASPLIELEEDI